MPDGWWVHPSKLPIIGLGDSVRGFRDLVRSLVAVLPDPSGVTFDNPLVRSGTLPQGRVVLELWPVSNGRHLVGTPVGIYAGGAAFRPDTIGKVASAVRGKRDQARAFPDDAVLLAIGSDFTGPDLEDFDHALYGRDPALRTGALTRQSRPEYAGVLVFRRVTMLSAADPILYPHPLSAAPLPSAIQSLHRRVRIDGPSIDDVAAQRVGIMEGLRFAEPEWH